MMIIPTKNIQHTGTRGKSTIKNSDGGILFIKYIVWRPFTIRIKKSINCKGGSNNRFGNIVRKVL